MSEPTDNQKRAERLAKQNARNQERLERRRITLERRQEAEAIVEETGGKKEHALNIYKAQLEMAIASQKRIEEQIRKQIQELEDKFIELDDDLEDKRDASLKKLEAEKELAKKRLEEEFQLKEDSINEKFDAKADKQKEMYEERIKKLKNRLKENETRPQVENMKMIIENTKNLQTFKKKTVAEVVRELEQQDIDQALEEIPTIRQNVIVQENQKQNKKLLEEAHCDQFICKGCQDAGEMSNHIFEKPAFNDGTWDYCSVCVREGRVPEQTVVRTAPIQIERFQCSGCCIEDGGWILETPSYSNGDEKYCACCVEEEKHIK